LTVVPLVVLDEIMNAGRHVPHLQIAAAAQLLGDIFGGVLRPAFDGVEGDNPDGVFVLAREQIEDHGFQIGALDAGFPIDAPVAPEIVDDKVDILLVALGTIGVQPVLGIRKLHKRRRNAGEFKHENGNRSG